MTALTRNQIFRGHMPYADPQKRLEANCIYHRKWAAAHREEEIVRNCIYRAANRERAREIARKWREANPAKNAAKRAQAHAAKLKRTPRWSELDQIRDMYAIAEAWREAGFDVHVDHQVPLRGRLVSGLHVLANLNILPARDNMSKGNRT